jgi:aminoglycoside phosphotransferase family enzyme
MMSGMSPKAVPGVQEIADFLADPASYPYPVKSVVLVETHASIVALAGPLVYKVKKPVNYGFLDYSTPDRRRYFCEREIELNRVLCPDVYLGVVPVVRCGGRLKFDPSGVGDDVVDYAVHMRRLEEAHFLSSRLDRGNFEESDIQRVANVLVAFYKRQPCSSNSIGPSLESLRATVLDNLQRCVEAAAVFPDSSYRALRDYAERFLATRSALLQRRIDEGWVRECHGDLRPDHVHLAPDRVRIYDCIEFNDALRVIDVAADVAFLSMELAFVHHWTLSTFLLTQIAEGLRDHDMRKLVDFYHCYRALVRAKVLILLAAGVNSGDAARRHHEAKSRKYVQLALRFALFGSLPIALVVMGPVGSGKSTLAAALGDSLGWPVLSSDRVRKGLAELPLHERADAATRQALYSESFSRRTYRRLTEMVRESSEHHGAVIDATFGRRAARDELNSALVGFNWRVQYIELTAPDELVRARLRAREQDSCCISDARLDDLERLRGQYNPPVELSNQLIRVDSGGIGAKTLEIALARLMDRSLRDDEGEAI